MDDMRACKLLEVYRRIGIDCSGISPVPRYVLLANELTEAIRKGSIPTGTLLPSERELAALMGASPWMVNKTLTTLVAAGFLHRERGVGTHVLEPPRSHLAADLLEELTPVDGLRCERSIEVRDPGLEHGGTLSVIRVLHRDGSPVALLRSELSPGLSVDADAVRAVGLYEALAVRHARPVRSTDSIAARPATSSERRALQAPDQQWVLELTRVSVDHRGRAVERAVHAYLPTLFRAGRVVR